MTNAATRAQVFAALDGEDEYAKRKWGKSDNDRHEIASWILYMEHHLAKARAITSSQSPESDALHEIRKVVNLGVNAMVNHGAVTRDQETAGV